MAIIERDWAESFGCELARLHAPGIALLANAADFADYSGAYLLRWEDGRATFTVPAPWRERVAPAIAGRGIERAFDRGFLAALFGDHVERIIGPAVRHCADASDFRPIDGRGTRLLTDRDEAALLRLREACGAEDWDESGLGAEGQPHFGCFVGEELAAAGMLFINGPLRNIGVVTQPAHRRQGYGRAVVSAMSAYAIAEGAIPHYQALGTNDASLALARSLGFVRYARSLAVRLKAE
jgi:GNAT superfamily N-acetyltransferase